MKHIALNTLVAATVCITAPAMAKTQQLTESMVKQMIDESKRLVKKQDIDGFAKYLSDDVKITMNIKAGGQITPLKLNKNEYISQTKEGFKLLSNYSYAVKVNDIKIKGDTALIDSTVTESMTMSGMPMLSTTQERAVAQLKDGTLKITELTGDASMEIKQQ